MRSASAPGFTLLELLVAIAVLSVIASLGFRGLGALTDAEAHVRVESDRWAGVARFMEQVTRDLSLAVEPPSADGSGTLLIHRRSEGDASIADVAPRRVAFRVHGERLEYVAWPAEGAGNLPPVVMPILDKVVALEWYRLDAQGARRPAVSEAQAAPGASLRAIEARLTLHGGERVTRLFMLP